MWKNLEYSIRFSNFCKGFQGGGLIIYINNVQILWKIYYNIGKKDVIVLLNAAISNGGHLVNEKFYKNKIKKYSKLKREWHLIDIKENGSGGFFLVGRFSKKSFFDLENPNLRKYMCCDIVLCLFFTMKKFVYTSLLWRVFPTLQFRHCLFW